MLRRAARFALVPIWLALSGCSADAVVPPEPAVERPGSFVFVTDDLGSFLIRTLRVVPIDSRESLLEAIYYSGVPSSADEALTWAKDPTSPIAERHATFSLRAVLELSPEVVWFRTLTDSELEALR